jgi:hypothetical protein
LEPRICLLNCLPLTLKSDLGKHIYVCDTSNLLQEVKALLLLTKVHQGRGRREDANKALLRARDVQNNVLAKTRQEQPETVRTQKQVMPLRFLR